MTLSILVLNPKVGRIPRPLARAFSMDEALELVVAHAAATRDTIETFSPNNAGTDSAFACVDMGPDGLREYFVFREP